MFQQSVQCPAAEVNLHMLTLHHWCKGPILLMWEGEQGQVLGYHRMTYVGCAGSPGETLGRSIIASLTWRQTDLSYQDPVLVSRTSVNMLENEALLQERFMQKDQSKTVTVYKWQKNFKMATVTEESLASLLISQCIPWNYVYRKFMVVKTLSSFTKEDSIFLSNQRFDQNKTQNLFSRQITLNKILVYNFLLRADQRQKKNLCPFNWEKTKF